MRREQLALRAKWFERMPRRVEPDRLFLLRQPLRLRPRRDVRERELRVWLQLAVKRAAEHRYLSRRRFLLLERRFTQRLVENRGVLRAVTAEAVERARLNERLEHALVADAQVNAIGEIEQRLERAIRARRDNRIDRRAADVSDCAESEADSLLADDGELVSRLVDIRRQQLEPEVARFVDVLDDAVGVADLRRQQRRHEVGGEVRLEPRGVVRDDRVRDRVRLVESIPAERLELAGDLLDDAAIVTARHRLLDELSQLRADEHRILLAHRLAKHVGFGERDARELLRDAHHLLLVGDDAVSRVEHLAQLGQQIGDRLFDPSSAGSRPCACRRRAGPGASARWTRRDRRICRTSCS